jgi:hypothetical protein
MSMSIARVRTRTSTSPPVRKRRRIDPTTCDHDYTADQLELSLAMDAYKRSSGRMFPTWREVLEVLTGLGYAKTKKPRTRKGLPRP